MVILQKIFAAFLSIFAFFTTSNPFIALFSSGLNEAKFIAAINDGNAAALEAMCSKRLKDAYPDLADKLAEFCGLMDQLTDEPLVKGTFDDWEGVFATAFEQFSDRIGYPYVKGNYRGGEHGGMTSGASEVWWHQYNFGNLASDGYGDYRIFVDWAKISIKDKGITSLCLIKDWVHTGAVENAETLFEIKVDWD